jgi:hypothetical protein
MSVFRWTKQTIQAARLVADGRLTEIEIAVEVGISDRQLRRWKHIPEFQSKVRKQRGLPGATPCRLAAEI